MINKTDLKLSRLSNMAKRVVAVVVLAAVFCVAPAAIARAADEADPGLSDLPGAYDELNKANEALKQRIKDLETIIKLNVDEAEGIAVLLYHHIVNEKDMTEENRKNGNIISTELFTEHMKYLHDNKYYTASVEELEQYIAGKSILPEKTVVITFDDGYRSNTKYCYPILKKYGFKATIFLITGLIGEKENVIEHASWNDMKKCADVFSYSSHSHNMHTQDKNGKSLFVTSTTSEVRRDLLLSRGAIDSRYFAYPYGQSSEGTISALRRTGYRMAFTTEAGYVRKQANVFDLPRYALSMETSVEAFADIIGGAGNAGETSGN